MEIQFGLNLERPEVIQMARVAIENLYREGWLTREQLAIGRGNLAEAEMKLRLRMKNN